MLDQGNNFGLIHFSILITCMLVMYGYHKENVQDYHFWELKS